MPKWYKRGRKKYGKKYFRKKGFKSRYSKRAYKKAKWNHPSKTSQGLFTKDRTFVKLRYAEVVSSSAASAARTYVYSGTDIQDPNYTGTGVQPTGRDQYYGFYEKCVVHGSKIKVTALGSDSASATMMCVVPSTNAALADVYSSYIPYATTAKYSKHRVFGTTLYNGPKSVKNRMTTKKCLGLKRLEYEKNAQDSTNGPGDDEWYWNIMLYNLDGSAFDNTTYMLVELTYYCEFYHMKNINVS